MELSIIKWTFYFSISHMNCTHHLHTFCVYPGPECILVQQERTWGTVLEILDHSLLCLCPAIICILEIISEA